MENTENFLKISNTEKKDVFLNVLAAVGLCGCTRAFCGSSKAAAL